MKLCNYTHVVDNRNTYQTLMVAKVETIDMLAHGKIGESQCMNLNALITDNEQDSTPLSRV